MNRLKVISDYSYIIIALTSPPRPIIVSKLTLKRYESFGFPTKHHERILNFCEVFASYIFKDKLPII